MATTTTMMHNATTTSHPVDSRPTTSNPKITIPPSNNFETLRSNNWNKIDNYYQKIIADFKNKTQQISSGLNSSDQDKVSYAKFLQAEVNDYQSQIINIFQEMITVSDTNDDIIREQKLVVDQLESENDKIIKQIAILKDKKTIEKTESSGHVDNKNLIENELSHLRNWNFYSKIGITVLASIFVMLLIYRMYMSASSLMDSNAVNSSNTTNFSITTGNNRKNNTTNNSQINKATTSATTAATPNVVAPSNSIRNNK